MPAAGSEGEEGPARAGGEGTGPGGGGGAPAAEQAGPGTPKLCGYLQKLSGKGPLRGFRSRWFVFDPRRCYLYYFKGPQDPLPLGHLDIASACFSYHQPEAGAAAAGDEAAAFEVHSPNGAVAVLKVGPGPVPSAAARPRRLGWGGRRGQRAVRRGGARPFPAGSGALPVPAERGGTRAGGASRAGLPSAAFGVFLSKK